MPDDVAPSPVVRPAPDSARDARVAARRAADTRRAGRALDRLLADVPDLRATHYGREMQCVAAVDMHVDPHTCGL